MHPAEKIATALLIEARADLKAARLCLEGGVYSRSVSHSQHVAEKTLKAALAMRGIIITRKHIVSDEFARAYGDMPGREEVVQAAESLEDEGTRTEYAFFGQGDLPIWIPSEEYDLGRCRSSPRPGAEGLYSGEQFPQEALWSGR